MKKFLLFSIFTFSVLSVANENGGEEIGYKMKPIKVFGVNNSKYRIPSLISLKNGRIIAAADKRFNQIVDWNNIDTVIRISDDLGSSFKEEKTVIDLADSPNNTLEKSAFLIDPAMIDNDGEILMLVDMFPKSRGFFSVANAPAGSGYITHNDKTYQKLEKFNDEEYTYFIAEDGNVFKSSKTASEISLEETDLKVVVEAEAPYKALGDLYEKSSNTRIGNIYRGKTDANENHINQYDGEYIVQRTAYLWLTRSNDNGETWKQPVDISHMFKKDYMSFLGTGPGSGIKLRNGDKAGRLIFPVYYTTDRRPNNQGERVDGRSQQSAVIYSDDNGETWKLGESVMENRRVSSTKVLNDQEPKLGGYQLTESHAVELNNGTLKLFMRGFHNSREAEGGGIHIATSRDGGETWEERTEEFPFEAPYSQVAAIHYGNVGEDEFVILSAPSQRKARQDGKIYLGKVNGDNIEWIANRVYNPGPSAYSSIAKLQDGDIGILYEGSSGIDYTRLSLDWIAPDYKFKEFLPYPKDYTEVKFAEMILDLTRKNSALKSFSDLRKNEFGIRYQSGKLTDKYFHNVEINSPIDKYVGIYGSFGMIEKENINFNTSVYGKYKNEYVDLYSVLGLDYTHSKETSFVARGNKIKLQIPHYIELMSYTNLKSKEYNYKGFGVNGEANLEFKYMPLNKSKATNQHDVTLDLTAKNLVKLDFRYGVNLSYANERLKVSLLSMLYNDVVYGKFNDRKVVSNHNGYEIKSKLDVNILNNLSTTSFVSYSNNFKNNNFGHLKGSLSLHYNW